MKSCYRQHTVWNIVSILSVWWPHVMLKWYYNDLSSRSQHTDMRMHYKIHDLRTGAIATNTVRSVSKYCTSSTHHLRHTFLPHYNDKILTSRRRIYGAIVHFHLTPGIMIYDYEKRFPRRIMGELKNSVARGAEKYEGIGKFEWHN